MRPRDDNGRAAGAASARASERCRAGAGSAAREDHVVALGAEDLDDDVAVVALELDDAVLGGAADPAALLEAAGELAQIGLTVSGQVLKRTLGRIPRP